MKLEQPRPGVYRATLTAHELTALVAGARMAHSLMEQDPTGATGEAREALAAVLREVDAALSRAGGGRAAGEPPAPPG
jgi:predicted DNA-binding transcriptional regulator YafY